MNYEAPAKPAKQSAKLLSFEIGQRVRELRRKQSMTRRQLSEATAIDLGRLMGCEHRYGRRDHGDCQVR